jgi:putative copper resistance protein D
MLPDVLSVIARALSFVCALQAAGAALFLGLFAGQGDEVGRRIRRLGTRSAWAAMALVALHYGLEPARMAGDLAGIGDLSLQELAATSGVAIAALLRIVGLLLIIVGLKSAPAQQPQSAPGGAAGAGGWARGQVPYSLQAPASWLGAVLVAASFTATGHTAASESHRWALASLLVLHLLVIEFWFGALLPLVFATRADPQLAARSVQRFSRIATALVPLILIAGLGMAWLLIPSWQVLGEPYGQLLLAKLIGFGVLLGLAALNKWRLGPELKTAGPHAARRFQRTVVSEYVLIGAVLVITAVMTSFFSPEP